MKIDLIEIYKHYQKETKEVVKTGCERSYYEELNKLTMIFFNAHIDLLKKNAELIEITNAGMRESIAHEKK